MDAEGTPLLTVDVFSDKLNGTVVCRPPKGVDIGDKKSGEIKPVAMVEINKRNEIHWIEIKQRYTAFYYYY